MFLKIMSSEDTPDSDSRKSFTLIANVVGVCFDRDSARRAQAHVTFANDLAETFTLDGNAYLMNDGGKTVASFGFSPPH